MYSIVETQDCQLIKDILSIDYDKLVYDDSPSFEDFVPNVIDNVWFLLLQDYKIAGLITLEYLNYVLWIPHIVILEQYRGKGSETWGKQAAEYMKQQYGAKKLLAITPYTTAKRYAEKMGFKQLTKLTKSIKKNGELLDQYMLEKEL